MTLTIFKDGANKVERMNRVIKVLNHSSGTANDGMDIEVYFFNPDYSFEMKKIHLDKWDFFSIEA